jgi:hypothetical protein
MCLTQPGIVLDVDADRALVRADGRDHVVTNFIVPDLRRGEVVLIGLGTVLGRATADDSVLLTELRMVALGDEPQEGKEIRP